MNHERAMILDAFERVHEAVPQVLAGLDAEQLGWHPAPEANSIAWLIWHLARVEDDHMAGVAGAEQVWPQWAPRFDLPFPIEDIGYGQTAEQAHQVRGDAGLLAGYYEAVHARTVEIVTGLTDADLERIVDPRWVPPVTAAVRIVSVINDITQHIGQAAYLRGLLTAGSN